MNDIQILQRYVAEKHPGATAKIEEPLRPDGFWSLDVDEGIHKLAIQWAKGKGFSLTEVKDAFYGEGAHEMFGTMEAVKQRVSMQLYGTTTEIDGWKRVPEILPHRARLAMAAHLGLDVNQHRAKLENLWHVALAAMPEPPKTKLEEVFGRPGAADQAPDAPRAG